MRANGTQFSFCLSFYLRGWRRLFEVVYSCDRLDGIRLSLTSFLVGGSGETWYLSAVPQGAIPRCRTA
jgi:hypothetical protein